MNDRLIQSIRARVNIPDRRTDATDVVVPDVEPLASSEQVESCEALLGFRLPVLLRRLYLEIGNGGFGPGYGFFPVPNGTSTQHKTLVSLYNECRQPPKPDAWEWPAGLLMICDWGCMIRSCVYAAAPNNPILVSTEYGVQRTRWTLESWLADWASNVDLWEVMAESDDGFAPHPVTGQPMEFP